MPEGYADKVYTYMGRLAQRSRADGTLTLTVRVGDVVEALEERFTNAALDVKQVLTTTTKLTRETGLRLQTFTGSGQSLDSIFTFEVGVPGTALDTDGDSTKQLAHVVTGATGYTGRYITEILLAKGEQVRSLTGHPDRPNPFGDAVELLPFNFDDPGALTRNLEGTDTLFNTYWVRVARGDLTHDRAAANLRTLFGAAKAAGVRRVVHVSITNAAAGSALSYFRCKGEVENALRESGLSYAILRPTLVFGKEDVLLNNIAWMLRRFPLFLVPGSGEYRVQPVCVEDLAKVAVAAGEADEKMEVDAVGPDVLTYDGLVMLVARAVGTSVRLVHVPAAVVMAASRALGMVVRDVVLSRDEVAGLSANLLVSGSDAKPLGKIRLGDWLDEHASGLGRGWANEMARHYR